MTAGIPDEQRERWRQLSEKIVSGEWTVVGPHRTRLVTEFAGGHYTVARCAITPDIPESMARANAEFIAEARQAVPALLAENDAQAAEIKRLGPLVFETQLKLGFASSDLVDLRAQVAELTAAKADLTATILSLIERYKIPFTLEAQG